MQRRAVARAWQNSVTSPWPLTRRYHGRWKALRKSPRSSEIRSGCASPNRSPPVSGEEEGELSLGQTTLRTKARQARGRGRAQRRRKHKEEVEEWRGRGHKEEGSTGWV
eukprot:4829174-Pleurochrysis_carterae.AAC.2